MSTAHPTPPGAPADRPDKRRSTRRVAVIATAALAAGLVGVPPILGSAWLPWSLANDKGAVAAAAEPVPIADVPVDDPARGLVHGGLTAAKKGTACVGKYEINGTGLCSHGPDAAPPGLNVKKNVAPVAPARAAAELPAIDAADAPADRLVTEGVAPDGQLAVVPDAGPASTELAADNTPKAESRTLKDVAVGPHGVVCDGDGTTGKRVQVLYVREPSTTSRFAEYQASFRTWAAAVDTIYDASAKETGGSRHLRYVTTADCQVDVREVEVPAGTLNDFDENIKALRDLGWGRGDRKYMIFAESNEYCGIGTGRGDDRPGAENEANGGDDFFASYGRTDTGCWSAAVAAHELGHNLGAVNNSAPNSSQAGHCSDGYDVMCYDDEGAPGLDIVCEDKAHEERLDCNHDDYYNTNPAPGSYLATHWNVANNQFLIKGDTDGGTNPSPSPTASKPPPVRPGATIKVSDLQPNSVRLNWPPKGSGQKYGLVVNDKIIGWIGVTGVRLIGLTPGTTYRVAVVTGSENAAVPYAPAVTVKTPVAEVPKAGAVFSLRNSLTGTVAELYGARSADRTPVTLHEANGTVSQQWRLDAADGGFRLVSKVTGKCLSPVGDKAKAGVPLIQQACSVQAADQVFSLRTGPAGLILSSGDLVVGLSQNEFDGERLLVLQHPSQARHQAWAALPA